MSCPICGSRDSEPAIEDGQVRCMDCEYVYSIHVAEGENEYN